MFSTTVTNLCIITLLLLFVIHRLYLYNSLIFYYLMSQISSLFAEKYGINIIQLQLYNYR